MTREQLQQTLDRLVAMKLVEIDKILPSSESPNDSDPSYSIHPAVRDGFLSGLDADTARQGHEARGGLPSRRWAKNRASNPSDPATLDLLEEIDLPHARRRPRRERHGHLTATRIGGHRTSVWRLEHTSGASGSAEHS